MQTILVIDDDENLRDTIGVLLEREGFRAILAPDGRSGLDQALLGKPDLILADLRLPDIQWAERAIEQRYMPLVQDLGPFLLPTPKWPALSRMMNLPR
jgi:DNA-binding response OmpR family regulator